jgi:hypothetical protein
MTPEVLIGNGPLIAVNDAIVLGVMGRNQEARLLLEGFLPDLLNLLSDSSSFNKFPEFERRSRCTLLSEQAYIANWLLTGRFDADLGRLACDSAWRYFRFISPKAKPDSLFLFHLMLFAVELDEYERAKELYLEFEKSPVTLPPETLRFARNPRALIYAHLNEGKIPHEVLSAARNSFRNAATKWEKDVCPIPYVSMSDAARVLSGCFKLIRECKKPSHLLGLLK